MLRVQSEIAATGAELGKDLNYLVFWLEYSNDQMFIGLVKKVVHNSCKAWKVTYEASKKTGYVYADDWQFRLIALSKSVVDSLATPASAFQVAFDVLPTPAPDFQASSGFWNNDGAEYQFNAGFDLRRSGVESSLN